jgi:ribosomal protein L16 Arg81 hydroxylase
VAPDDRPGDPGGRPALRRCVTVPTAEFDGAYWGRRPLLSAGAARTGFADLLGLDDVDELLSRRGLRTPFVRLARAGQVLPAADFTGSGGLGAEVADQVLDDRVTRHLAEGATVVLQGLHRLWPPLIDFCGRLGAELGGAVQANAYLTPAGRQGFATHYDTHDVFVLQVAGTKRWLVHPPVLTDPLRRQPWGGPAHEVRARAEGPPTLDEVLRPGDALYLPRGWLHSAEALGEVSLHVTLGLRQPTRHTIVEVLAALAAEVPGLRAGFGPGTDLTDPDQLAPELKSTVEVLTRWLEGVRPEDVADRLRPALWAAARPAPVRPVAQAAAAAATAVDTTVAARAGLPWRLSTAGDRATLQLSDRSVSFPAWCAPAVRAALGGPAVRVGDLPGLSDRDRVMLARRLLREAVVVPVSS